MTEGDTTGKALVEHWKYAAEKGLMKPNTAMSLRAACMQVLSVLDGWEHLDVRALDIDDVFRRFQNKRSKEFKPASLQTYKSRFANAVKMFLEYAAEPSKWKPRISERAPRRSARGVSHDDQLAVTADESPAVTVPGRMGLVDYPFPLREGRPVYLRLPADLRTAEVRRLTAYLMTLVIDSEPIK